MPLKEDIERIHTQIETLSIDEIKAIIDPHQRGMMINSLVVHTNSFLYRGRRFDDNLKKTNPIKVSDLSYQKTNAKAGRANRPGSSVFYCCSLKETVFYELRVSAGDEFILSNWQTMARLPVNNVGYTESIFQSMGAGRACPEWAEKEGAIETFSLSSLTEEEKEARLKKLRDSDAHFELREFYNTEFTRKDERYYKLTTAIAEQHLGKIQGFEIGDQFGGVMYPTVRMAGNDDNIALLPWYVDRHLVFKRASHIKVTAIEDGKISFSEVDYATTLNADGHLIWKGGPIRWNVLPGYTAHDTVGTDEFGFYERIYDGKKVRWEIRDEKGGVVSAM